jgi:archaellum component FlaG (FlaF/FlaG flagellin family)
MGMAATVVAVFKSMLDDSTSAAAREKQRAVNVMQTSFTIPSASYSAGTVYVYVKNTGDASFDPEEMDIYLDGIRIPRDITNRTVNVTVDTDVSNVGTWDPGEELEFNVFTTYGVPASHAVVIYSSNGVSAESIFSS